MADPLNKDCFFPPKLAKFELEARGLVGGQQNGGMSHVQRVHLSLGQEYIRFCDSHRFASDPTRAAAGGWWAGYEDFLRVQALARRSPAIQDYAARAGVTPLSYAAKLFFAIPYEWGDCENVVKAEFTARLDAFRGRGLTAFLNPLPGKVDARDGGAKYTPIQDPNVSQLFIPELHVHFAAAVRIVDQGPASRFG